MRIQMTPKTVRRLLSADGYLDLGMPERAVQELDKIEDAGPLEGPTQLLHGIALKQTSNFRDAITHLERAARIMPSPIRRFAWRELVEAYKAVGSDELAEMAPRISLWHHPGAERRGTELMGLRFLPTVRHCD